MEAVLQAGASADPFIERMALHIRAVAAFNAAEDDEGAEEPSNELCREIRAGRLSIISAAGAALALRRLIDLDCIVDSEGRCMADAVLAFLEAEQVR